MLIARIVEEHDRRAKHIVSGAPKSLEEYREQVGFIRGLTHARNLCESVETELYAGPKQPT